MLIIFVGPSGVGKTTLISLLVKTYDWKLIPIFHTRSKRANDIKISIDPAEFEKLEEMNFFYSVQSVHGNKYAQPKLNVEHALANNNEKWVFDLALSQIDQYKNTKALIFVILPDGESQLINNLRNCNREIRINEVIEDYRKYYLPEHIKNYKHFINHNGKQEQVVHNIANYINNVHIY